MATERFESLVEVDGEWIRRMSESIMKKERENAIEHERKFDEERDRVNGKRSLKQRWRDMLEGCDQDSLVMNDRMRHHYMSEGSAIDRERRARHLMEAASVSIGKIFLSVSDINFLLSARDK